MTRHFSRFFTSFLFYILLACGQGPERQEAGLSPLTVTDDLGRRLSIPAHPQRIMALAPSMTEMLFAVCPDSSIVARTQNCDFPARALAKPVVNNFPLDVEQVLSLRPDLIFTTDGITPLEAAERLGQLGIPVYYQRYETVADVLRGLSDIGRLMHRQEQARRLTDSLQAELRQLVSGSAAADSPRVLVVAWHDPIYVYGRNTLMSDKLRLAGGRNAVQEVFDQPYPALTREYVLKLNPDVILSGDFGEMQTSFFQLYPELRQTAAYQRRKVFATTDNLTARPSPRVVESVRELKSLIH